MLNVNRCPLAHVLAFCFASTWGLAWGESVSVHIAPHKTVVMVGEPVFVAAALENQGSEAVKLIYHNAPVLFNSAHSVVDLRLGTDTEHLEHWSDRLRSMEKVGPMLLSQGKSATVDLVMLFNAKNGLFTEKAGTFWIQGRVVIAPNPYVEVLSDPVPIEVREPTPADKPMWEWLNAHKEEYGRLVQIPWEAKLSDEFLKGCDDGCNKTPSVYTEYIALFLSRWYQEGPGKDRENAREHSLRFAEIAKARATSEKVRAEAEKVLAKIRPSQQPEQK